MRNMDSIAVRMLRFLVDQSEAGPGLCMPLLPSAFD